MRTSVSAQYALSLCALIALLAGCNNGGSQLTSPSGLIPQKATLPSLNVDRLIRTTGRIGTETMTASKVRGTCQFEGLRDYVDFVASGSATGPYPGSFDSTIQTSVSGCPAHQHGTAVFFESFNVTSGPWFISGETAKSGPGFLATYTCSFRTCSQLGASSPWTYDATFIRGVKARKARSGEGSESGWSGSSFTLTLNSL